MPNTKIVATLGPASDTLETTQQLVESGVDVFRLNASHGTQEEMGARIERARAVNPSTAILLDLQGPKIRLGRFANGPVQLESGTRFTITTEECIGTREQASTTYADFAKDVKAGDRVLLNDGAVELRAMRTDGKAVECEVVSGGPVSDRKGINLPGVQVSTPSLSKKDMADLRFGLEHGIDMVALSFVRKHEDLLRLRHFLEELESAIPIVAKIEKPEAWRNLDEILEESDGVMVARGDLGVEMALEKVPFIQKSIIARARARNRFVITATQMLESMIHNPYPTRAEVSDVANAIHDGTDAVMLSAETSAGSFPVEAVRMMRRVAVEAETTLRAESPDYSSTQVTEIIAASAYHSACLLNSKAIIVFTTTGRSARLVSRYRPPMPIYAFTASPAVARQLAVIYGARAVQAPDCPSTDEMVAQMDRILVEREWAKPGDQVVFVSGQPIGKPGTTNMMKVHTVL